MEELKKCPFCGGEAIVRVNTEMGGSQYQVFCTECPVTVGRYWYWNEEQAITAWNTRKPMERIVERLEEEYKNAIDARDDAAEMLYKKQRVNWENENKYYDTKSDGIKLTIEIVKAELS